MALTLYGNGTWYLENLYPMIDMRSGAEPMCFIPTAMHSQLTSKAQESLIIQSLVPPHWSFSCSQGRVDMCCSDAHTHTHTHTHTTHARTHAHTHARTGAHTHSKTKGAEKALVTKANSSGHSHKKVGDTHNTQAHRGRCTSSPSDPHTEGPNEGRTPAGAAAPSHRAFAVMGCPVQT